MYVMKDLENSCLGWIKVVTRNPPTPTATAVVTSTLKRTPVMLQASSDFVSGFESN